jgi:hypothetical protein
MGVALAAAQTPWIHSYGISGEGSVCGSWANVTAVKNTAAVRHAKITAKSIFFVAVSPPLAEFDRDLFRSRGSF